MKSFIQHITEIVTDIKKNVDFDHEVEHHAEMGVEGYDSESHKYTYAHPAGTGRNTTVHIKKELTPGSEHGTHSHIDFDVGHRFGRTRTNTLSSTSKILSNVHHAVTHHIDRHSPKTISYSVEHDFG